MSSLRYANGPTSLKIITDETPVISEYINFAFYDRVIYTSNAGVDPPELGRLIGVSHCICPFMYYWILPTLGISISCNTVQHFTHLEKQIDEVKERMKAFIEKVNYKLDALSADITTPTCTTNKILSLQDESDDFLQEYNGVINLSDLPDIDDDTQSPLCLGEMNIYIWK